MMNEVFLITNILSKFLQHANITLTDALTKVDITIDSLHSLQNEYEFKRIWDYTMKVCIDNDIDEPTERHKRKIPLRFRGGEINPTIVTVQDEYLINSFYAVIDNIVKSIKERFDENHLSIVILCEKLFLTKLLLIEDDLKQFARFYNISYDDLRAEQRLYKTTLVFRERKEWTLAKATKFFVEQNLHLSLTTINILLKIL